MSETVPTAERERFTGYMQKAIREGGRKSIYSIAAAIKATCPKCNGLIRQAQLHQDVVKGKSE